MCVVFMLSSPHQINWLRVDEDVPPHAVVTGSDLYIENLNKSYNGTYRCVASNAVGEAYDDYILYVYGRYYTSLQLMFKSLHHSFIPGPYIADKGSLIDLTAYSSFGSRRICIGTIRIYSISNRNTFQTYKWM